MKNLQIGTYGWQHDAWQGTFYPEDLPKDWRLDYFCNAYRVVLVPQTEWQSWSQETLLDIMACVADECVDHEFGFYLAIQNSHKMSIRGGGKNLQPLEPLFEPLSNILSVLGSRVLGFVVWSEVAFTQLEVLQRPVTLVSTQYRLSGWHWRWNGFWVSGNPLGWIELLPENGKVQAELLRSFVDSLPEVKTENKPSFVTALPFIVGGGEINMEHVTNLKTIGELLGY